MPSTFHAKWDGHAIHPVSNLDMIRRLPINTLMTLEFKQRRSAKHHRRFFAFIRAAFDLWPKQHEFKPENESHLRAWGTIKARHGHFVAFEFPNNATADDVARVAATIAAEIGRHEHAFVRPHGGRLVVWYAKTISWAALDQREFAPIAQAIEDVLCAEIGVGADAILSHAKEMAQHDDAPDVHPVEDGSNAIQAD